MHNVNGKQLAVRLPKLGPLIGWLRRDDADGSVLARLWAKADDGYGAAPLAAVTVPWDKSCNRPAGKPSFWPMRVVRLEEADPGAKVEQSHYFAVADVRLRADSVVRMAFVHGLYPKDAGDEEFILSTAAWLRESSTAKSELEAMDASGLFGDAVPALAEKLFKDLEGDLQQRRDVGAGPIPRSLSRHYRQVGSIDDCEATVSAPCAPDDAVLCFAAGCCRHPGMQFDHDLADRAFGALAGATEKGLRLGFVAMLGDQIYPDATAGVIDVGEQTEKYVARYDDAFGSKNFRRLTSRVPTYMLVDDHEVRDGWPDDVLSGTEGHWNASAVWARNLYLAHQSWHAPGPLAPPDRQVRNPRGLCYGFEHNGVPFFAFDTRFQREPGGDRIIGPDQMAAFDRWLARVAELDVPKFVMTGSVFAPGLVQFQFDAERRADNWQQFPAQRSQLAVRIAESQARNVVLLSGDYHCAAAGSMWFQAPGGRRADGYAIVAPPFYAPFPFANVRESEVLRSDRIRYGPPHSEVAACDGAACETHGFAVIRIRKTGGAGDWRDWAIEVEFHEDCWDAKGAPGATRVAAALLANGKVVWLA